MSRVPETRATSARLNTGPRPATVIQSTTAPRSGPGGRVTRSAPLPTEPPAISAMPNARPRRWARSPAPTAARVAAAPARVIMVISTGRPCPRPKATPALCTSRARNGPSRACGPEVPLQAASARALLTWSAAITRSAASGKSNRPECGWGFMIGLPGCRGPVRGHGPGPGGKPGGDASRFPPSVTFRTFPAIRGRWRRVTGRGHDGGPAGGCLRALAVTSPCRCGAGRGHSDVFPFGVSRGIWYSDSIFILFLSIVFQSLFSTPPVSPESGFQVQ